MRNLLQSLNKILALLILPAALHALAPSQWQYLQVFPVESAGPRKISLPAETLDHARSDLRDLRIIGPAGQELPYLALRPSTEPEQVRLPKTISVTLQGNSTVIILETGTKLPLASVELRTGARSFLKPARIECSDDGRQWENLAEGMPFFRQDAAEQTTLPLGHRSAAFLRVTLGDERMPPVAVTGATLHLADAMPAPIEPLHPQITKAENFGSETVISLDLGAANLMLASLKFICPDKLFSRPISVAVRELHGDEIVERVLARGSIYRMDLDGLTPIEHLDLAVNATVPTRELIVHVENGDSPPLNLSGFQATRRPVYLVFAPLIPGPYELRTGNPQAAAPAYDLAPLGADLSRLPVTTVSLGAISIDPDYHPSQPLDGLVIQGAPLDPTSWSLRKAVLLTSAGVQQLELDLDVLSGARPDLADVRLVRDEIQIPYILERTTMSRALTVTPIPDPDPKRPSISRWKLALPRASLPIARITLTSSTSLFQRHLRFYEIIPDYRGDPYQQSLVDTDWVHTPGNSAGPQAVSLPTRPQTGTLWLETDNADNPPIIIEHAQVFYPVTRLLFKAEPDQPLALLYGNTQATAPRYDVGLVAMQLLAAEKMTATAGKEEASTSSSRPVLFKGTRNNIIFWGALTVVIVLLLTIVAKLLPKPPT